MLRFFVPTFCLLAPCLPLLAGCGHSEAAPAELQASELFELLEEQELRYDAQAYAEVDLGEFKVTHALGGAAGQLHVRFHLIGIVAEQREAKVAQVLPHYETRV